MIKVIEHGYKKYYVKCLTCGCYFEYELEDIERGLVKCPDCGHNCPHSGTINAKLTSQIGEFDEVEE